MHERRRSGFKQRTRLGTALDRLAEVVAPLDRRESLAVTDAVGRVLAEPVGASRPVPHYDRAAMDGFAVRAADTFDAGDRAPTEFEVADVAGDRRAVPVHTGSPIPDGADAVVRVEETRRIDSPDAPPAPGDRIELSTAVASGENVAPTGEDVAADETVLDSGRRVGPTDPGLCKSVGVSTVTVYDRPEVAVVPTGDELVDADPGPGEVVETNGVTAATLTERWGGEPRYREVVGDDRGSLREAIERDLDADLVATTGGTSVGERDLLPEVLADLGDVVVHGLAIKPGHPVGVAVVDGTPVLMLPGYPVSTIVTATQLLRPAIKWAGRLPVADHPAVQARLDEKLASEVGVRTFARVRWVSDVGSDDDNGDTEDASADEPPRVEPVRTGGAGVLSSVARADGWVVVPESREGVPADERVAVEQWESQP